MKSILIKKIAVVFLCVAIQTPQNSYAEPSEKYIGSATTQIAWVWTPDYARRFGLPGNTSQLGEGAIKAIGLRVSRVEAIGQMVRYFCSVELITDGTQQFLFHDMPSHSNQPYENADLRPGSFTDDVDKKVANKARLEGRTLPAYLGYTQVEDIKQSMRYMSAQYRLYRKDYLPGLQYASFNTGCLNEFLHDGTHPVLFVAHASYLKKGWIYDDPSTYRIVIPNALLIGLRNDLKNAIETNAEYVREFDKNYRKKK